VYIRASGQSFGAGTDAGNPTVGADGEIHYVVTGITPGVRTYFAVSAYTGGSESTLSNELSLMVSLTPTATASGAATSGTAIATATPTAMNTVIGTATRTATPPPSASSTATRTRTATPTATPATPATPSPTAAGTSIWDATAVPALAADPEALALELGVKFTSDVDGLITGIRFYKSTANTGTHTGSLWSGAGARLATATFTNEMAAGWQQVTFPFPVAIAANTVYVASYHTDVGHYSGDEYYFATAGLDNPPLHALRDGVSGGNGVYAYGASAFPTSTFHASNYWVDVVFTAAVPAATATRTASNTATPPATSTPPASATATATASLTATRIATLTATTTRTATGTATNTSPPTPSVSNTATRTATATYTATAPPTATATATRTASATNTALPSSTATATRTASASNTVAPSQTPPPPASATASTTYSATATHTSVPTSTASATPTASPTDTATRSLTTTPTATPVPAWNVSIPTDARAVRNGTVSVPVNIESGSGVRQFSLRVAFDPTVIAVQDVRLSADAGAGQIDSSIASVDAVSVSATLQQPMTAGGALVEMSFTAVGSCKSSTALDITTCVLDGGAIGCRPIDGALQVRCGVGGRIKYWSDAAAVSNTTVAMLGTETTATATTDQLGQFSFGEAGDGNWQLEPQKSGDLRGAVSALDAAIALQAAAGTRRLDAVQALACDVTGNGQVSGLDATRILQLAVGRIQRLPVSATCDSDWAFIPTPANLPDQHLIQPLPSAATCQRGSVVLDPLVGDAPEQDFTAVLFGDCTGNWSSAGRGAARLRRARDVRARLGVARARAAGQWVVPLYVVGAARFSAIDAQLAYDPAARPTSVRAVGAAHGAVVRYATDERAALTLALASAAPIESASGLVALVVFDAPDRNDDEPLAHLLSAAVDEVPVSSDDRDRP
jgi:hypothetical protein